MSEPKIFKPNHVWILPDGISIDWEDGHSSFFPHRELRLNCRCAACVGEWPNQGELNPDTVSESVYAVEYQTIGNYAVQFLWSDTHYTGIYPYQVLRELCPCPICSMPHDS